MVALFWDYEDEFAGDLFREKLSLRCCDLTERICLAHERTDFPAFNVGYKVLEDEIVLKCAAVNREVLEINRTHVDLNDRARDSASYSQPTAFL